MSILLMPLLAMPIGVAIGCAAAFAPLLLRKLHRQRGKKAATALARDVLPYYEFVRLKRRGYVEVEGASGQHYRIQRGKSVEVIGKYSLCVGPVGRDAYPEDDLVVLYYLYITGDEEHFLRVANPMARSFYA